MLIGEVTQRSGISARMLRHYDRIGLVTPSGRTAGGYRDYSESDMRRLLHVEGLRSLGLSLAQVTDVIDDQAFDPAVMVASLLDRTRDQVARGQELVTRLEEVQTTAPRTWDDVLRTVGLIRGLDEESPSRGQRLALRVAGDDDRDMPVLVEAMLRERSEDAAGALQWAIARRGDIAVPALASALQSTDRERRRRAFDALVKFDTPAARQVILGSAGHDDPRVRDRAAIAHALHGTGGSIAALVELISAGRDDVEAADALAALAVRDGQVQQAVAALAAALEAGEVAARRRLVAALSELPLEATRPTLTTLLDDVDRGTALTARRILDTRG